MGETLQTLGVYWPKLIAQTVNFGIVLFILWKFAYRPVLTMLEQRRQRVAEAMQNAEKAKEELAKADSARQEIMNQANQQAAKLIEEARAAAARVQEQETQKAIAAAKDIVEKAQQATEAEHARMLAELRREVGRLVVNTTGKVIGRTLTPDDQKRLSDDATRELAA
ncbi:MAG: F0F1 ATP synthase subunit B [Verrucomicrobia subdivision 3 bacterium]|nr:F0F1 ATP synthase subunit B [Limisphaerales bacterium]